MLQYRRIKEFTPQGETQPIKFDEPVRPLVQFDSLSDFIKNYETGISQIPETERVNVYCTVNHVIPNVDKRVDNWKSQNIIFFDIDDVEQPDLERYQDYLEVMAPVLGTTPENLVMVTTGGGFHLLLEIKRPITKKSYFQDNKLYYQVLCSRINDKFRDAGLSGSMDTQVFAPNRMFRAPLSIWQKMGEQRPVILTSSPDADKLTPVEFDLKKLSGLPDIEDKDTMSEKELTYIKIDNATVETGCDFLKKCKSKPAQTSEPEWYAMMSIVGRLDKGESKVHDYSKGHPSYNEAVTQRKLEQALKLAGPRTCDNINTLWKGCQSCPNYKKVKSPIALKGKDFIATAHSGFRVPSTNGKSLIAQHEDLRRFYQKKTPYCNIPKMHYQFEGKKWEFVEKEWLDSYAEGQYKPDPDTKEVMEFRNKVMRTNMVKPQWFEETTARRINLQNGVLNIDTMEIEPHSADFGFKYVLPYQYDPEAKCPMFRQLLKNVTCDDVTLQMVLMEFMGYALSGDEPIAQKSLLMTGSGSNGKSTFLKVMKAVMGQGVVHLSTTDLKTPSHLQMIDGALINVMEEVPAMTNKAFWEFWKRIIEGIPVTVAAKYGHPYEIKPKCKFVLTCNELPKMAEQNYAYFRRLLLIPFNAKFDTKTKGFDRSIHQKIIAEELPGILNICLKAYRDFKKRGYEFTQSKAIDRALSDYQTEMDSVRRWVIDNVSIGGVDNVAELDSNDGWLSKNSHGDVVAVVKDMYSQYNQDTISHGEKPVSLKSFSIRLKRCLIDEVGTLEGNLERKIEFKKQRIDGKPCSTVLGISYWSGEL